jgi:hypothetical protein
MGRVGRAFAALLQWGEAMGIPYNYFYTPQEYTERLAAIVPAGAGQLGFVVEVFEEVMFSAPLVVSGRISQYLRTIRLLRRLTPEGITEAGWSHS